MNGEVRRALGQSGTRAGCEFAGVRLAAMMTQPDSKRQDSDENGCKDHDDVRHLPTAWPLARLRLGLC